MHLPPRGSKPSLQVNCGMLEKTQIGGKMEERAVPPSFHLRIAFVVVIEPKKDKILANKLQNKLLK